VLVALVRRELSAMRAGKDVPDFSAVISRMRASIDDLRLSKIQPVINGTGIIIHTNFGRAPLGPHVLESLSAIAQNYSNLEYDLGGGERGRRGNYLEQNLALLCGAEAATIVNNCAAALVLTLQHFANKKREVIISRGELIQIGGGFRIPDILEASGAKLREVGTTNKTTLDDYARAISADTALILKCIEAIFSWAGLSNLRARNRSRSWRGQSAFHSSKIWAAARLSPRKKRRRSSTNRRLRKLSSVVSISFVSAGTNSWADRRRESSREKRVM